MLTPQQLQQLAQQQRGPSREGSTNSLRPLSRESTGSGEKRVGFVGDEDSVPTNDAGEEYYEGDGFDEYPYIFLSPRSWAAP